MQRTIRLATTVPHAPDQVWRALTEPELLGSWFMANDIAPKLHHRFTFRMAPQKGWDGVTHCEVISLDPGRHLAYTFRGEATGEKALACAGIHSDAAGKLTKGIFTALDTIVSFTLEPTCGRTTLRLEQSGYRGMKLVLVSFIMQRGWKKQLRRKLPRALERLAVTSRAAP